MSRYKLVCNVNGMSVVWQTIVWFVLSVITLGIALPFFGYFFFKHIIDRTEIHQID